MTKNNQLSDLKIRSLKPKEKPCKSKRLDLQGYSPDLIERQLSHVPEGVRAVYNRAQYLPEGEK